LPVRSKITGQIGRDFAEIMQGQYSAPACSPSRCKTDFEAALFAPS